MDNNGPDLDTPEGSMTFISNRTTQYSAVAMTLINAYVERDGSHTPVTCEHALGEQSNNNFPVGHTATSLLATYSA